MFQKKMFPVLVTGALLLAGCGGDEPNPVDPTPPDPDPPVAPTGVQAALDVMAHTVTVTWNASANATSYTVERNLVSSGAGFSVLQSGIAGTSYTDENVPLGVVQYRVVAVGDGGSSAASAPAEVHNEAMIMPTATLTGTVGMGETRTLSADTAYTLTGVVTVDAGGELHIPAGTHIHGSTEVQPSALIVRVGGKLFSEGTEDAPVVFTSANPPEERAKGDWGGVVLNGASLCNFPAGQCVGEGSSGEYGGDDRTDNSGVIVYTRIEYAGYEVSFGNELNALTMNGVGNGTTIHHVQAHAGLDDGFEWFGGTVNTRYLLATDISDDSFDYSTGYQGMNQFWVAQQDPDDADTGFEVDGNEEDYDAMPHTMPLIANVTLIGKGMMGMGGTEGESTVGLKLRRGTAGHITGAIVMGFGGEGLDIDNASTMERVEAGLFSVSYSILASNARSFPTDDDGIDEEAVFMNPVLHNRIVDDVMLGNPFDRDHPDFTPQEGSPALESVPTLTDLATLFTQHLSVPLQRLGEMAAFFDTSVTFAGGVDPENDWTQEHWTTFSAHMNDGM